MEKMTDKEVVQVVQDYINGMDIWFRSHKNKTWAKCRDKPVWDFHANRYESRHAVVDGWVALYNSNNKQNYGLYASEKEAKECCPAAHRIVFVRQPYD